MKKLKARYSNRGNPRPWEFMITQERLQRAGLSFPFRPNTGERSEAMGFIDELEEAHPVEENVAGQSAPLLALPTITPSHEAGALQIGADKKKRKQIGSTKPTDEHLMISRKRTSKRREVRQKITQDKGPVMHTGSCIPTVRSWGVRRKKSEASFSDNRAAAHGHIQTLLKYFPPPEIARQYAPPVDKMPQSMQEIASLPVQELESAYNQLAALMSGFVYTLKEKQIYQREGIQEVLDKKMREIEFLNKQLQEAQNPVHRKGKEVVQDIELPEEEEGLRLAESEQDAFKARVEEMERKLKESDEARSEIELAWSENDNEFQKSRAEVDRLKTQLFFQEDTTKKHLSGLEIMKANLMSENQEQISKVQDLLDANEDLSSKAEGLDEECRRISTVIESQKLAWKRLESEGFSKFMASQEVNRIMKLFFLRVHRHGQRVGAAKAAGLMKDCFPELDIPLIDFSNDKHFRGRA